MNGSLMSLPPDLSPWTMFANAHIVVQAVMAGLALASLATWTVAAAKALELRQARRAAAAAFAGIADARSLAEAKAPDGPAAAMIAASHAELRLSLGLGANGVKDRIAARLSRIEAAAGRHAAAGTGVLATIGSTAPFVGLFGTVWGIMNSFVGIAQANTTNLAVVAPGIAEALLATALGLVAAIPAVVVYNICVRRIAAYRALLGDVAVALLGVVGRDLDRRVRPLSEAAE